MGHNADLKDITQERLALRSCVGFERNKAYPEGVSQPGAGKCLLPHSPAWRAGELTGLGPGT